MDKKFEEMIEFDLYREQAKTIKVKSNQKLGVNVVRIGTEGNVTGHQIVGGDVVLTCEQGTKYFAVAKVNGTIDGNEFTNKEFKFELANYVDGEKHVTETLMWKATEAYDTERGWYLYLDQSDIKNGGASTIYFGESGEIEILGVYKVVNGGEPVNVTTTFMQEADKSESDYQSYLTARKEEVGAYITGTLTLEGYAKKDVNAEVYVFGAEGQCFDVNKEHYLATDKNGNWTGTWMKEVAYGTEGDNVFALGTGKDKIIISGREAFGHDEVILGEGEKVKVEFKDLCRGLAKDADYRVVGNDVVVSQSHSYVLEVNLDGITAWGNPVSGIHTFELKVCNDVQFPNEYQGKMVWQDTTSYGTVDGKERYIVLDEGDIKDNKVLGTGVTFKMYRVINGHVDYSENLFEDYQNSVKTALAALSEDATKADQVAAYSNINQGEYDKQQVSTITFKNAAKEDIGAEIFVEGIKGDLLNQFFEPTPSYNQKTEEITYTGTWLNEKVDYEKYGDDAAKIQAMNETFDLKSGKDVIVYDYKNGVQGNDTVILSKGETLILNLGDGFSTVGEPVIVGKDVVLTTVTPKNVDKGINEDVVNTLTFKNLAAKDLGAHVFITNGKHGEARKFEALQFGFDATDVVKGKLTGTNANDNVDLTGYFDPKSKGVVVNTMAGDDVVTGSAYDDKINAGTGNNKITENFGTNKINAGSGNDTVEALLGSSNTIKVGDGNNTILLNSLGTNKVTSGKGVDTYDVKNGSNTISSGKGDDNFEIQGGVNKITSAEGADEFIIKGGLNTIKSTGKLSKTVDVIGKSNNNITTGNGNDKFTIENDSVNVINSGKGNDKFTINSGMNTIKTTAGDNTFDIAGGMNNITAGSGKDTFNITDVAMNYGDSAMPISTFSAGAGNDEFIVNFEGNSEKHDLYLDGGAGDDTYNLTKANFVEGNQIIITDTKGKNDVVLLSGNTNSYKAYFDVTATKSGYKLGTTIALGGDVADNSLILQNGLSKKGVCSIENFKFEDEKTYSISATAIDKIASDVAQWLNNNSFASTMDVMAFGTDAQKESMLGIFAAAQSTANIFGATVS